jgi:hypothetical protein
MADEQAPVTTTTTTVKASPPGLPPKVEVVTTTTSPLKAFGTWTAGIIGAFVSGTAGALSSGLAGIAVTGDAKVSLKIAGLTAIGSGVASLAKYLHIHPVPGNWDGVDRRTE